MQKAAQLKKDAAFRILGAELQAALQQTLPAALQAAGLDPAMLQSYIPQVLQYLIPNTASVMTHRLYNNHQFIGITQASPLFAQLNTAGFSEARLHDGAPVTPPMVVPQAQVIPPTPVTVNVPPPPSATFDIN